MQINHIHCRHLVCDPYEITAEQNPAYTFILRHAPTGACFFTPVLTIGAGVARSAGVVYFNTPQSPKYKNTKSQS